MARFRLAVRTRPFPGQETEYHRWYDDFHLDEVLQVPGFVAAERYAPLSDRKDAESGGDGGYLALFTIESDDIAETVAVFREAQRSMAQPPCLDPDSVVITWWRLLGSRTTESPSEDAAGA